MSNIRSYLVLALITSSFVVGCAAKGPDVGEWVPFTDGDATDDPKFKLAQKYDVPAKEHIFDGLAFWKESPLINVPTVAFHWYGDSFALWRQRGTTFDLEKHEIAVSQCPGLKESLGALLAAVAEDARKMTDQTLYSDLVYVDGVYYDLKYMSGLGGTIRLSNSQFDPVAWPAAAERAMRLGEQCVQA